MPFLSSQTQYFKLKPYKNWKIPPGFSQDDLPDYLIYFSSDTYDGEFGFDGGKQEAEHLRRGQTLFNLSFERLYKLQPHVDEFYYVPFVSINQEGNQTLELNCQWGKTRKTVKKREIKESTATLTISSPEPFVSCIWKKTNTDELPENKIIKRQKLVIDIGQNTNLLKTVPVFIKRDSTILAKLNILFRRMIEVELVPVLGYEKKVGPDQRKVLAFETLNRLPPNETEDLTSTLEEWNAYTKAILQIQLNISQINQEFVLDSIDQSLNTIKKMTKEEIHQLIKTHVAGPLTDLLTTSLHKTIFLVIWPYSLYSNRQTAGFSGYNESIIAIMEPVEDADDKKTVYDRKTYLHEMGHSTGLEHTWEWEVAYQTLARPFRQLIQGSTDFNEEYDEETQKIYNGEQSVSVAQERVDHLLLTWLNQTTSLFKDLISNEGTSLSQKNLRQMYYGISYLKYKTQNLMDYDNENIEKDRNRAFIKNRNRLYKYQWDIIRTYYSQ